MGDSGSLFLGFVMAWLGVEFLAVNRGLSTGFAFSNAALMLLAVLCYPLLDTLRVFLIRISQGRSPFSADRNHIHHRLLRIGFSHKQATIYIVVTSLVTLWIVFSIQYLDINIQLLIMLTLIPLLYTSPFLRIGQRQKRPQKKQLEFAVERSENTEKNPPVIMPVYMTRDVKPGPKKAQEESPIGTSSKTMNTPAQSPSLVDKRVEIYNQSKQNQEEISKEDSKPKVE